MAPQYRGWRHPPNHSPFLPGSSPPFGKAFRHLTSVARNLIAVAQDPDSALLNAVHALPAEAQRAVLSCARFLREEEERSRVREDEAGLDKHFQDPERMTRFASWAEKSLAGDESLKPLSPESRRQARKAFLLFARNPDLPVFASRSCMALIRIGQSASAAATAQFVDAMATMPTGSGSERIRISTGCSKQALL